MNRKLLMCICSFFVIIIPITCFAFQNEPNGFRNLYWGETLQEIQKNDELTNLKYAYYEIDTNSVIYTADLKDPYISGQKSIEQSISLYLWNNQLYKINVRFIGISFNKLENAMILNFGYPEQRSIGICSWHGNRTIIELCLGGSMGNTDIHLTNPYLLNEAKKEVAAKGW